jgi:outer membrane protein OmpA-like peptidoglycan-associated protein
MPFDYNKNKQGHSGDSFWTSYSDLFLGLSTIFLLLYVTASLRTGTDAIQSQVENQKLTMQVDELRSQLKMYEQVKADYLEKSASKSEMQEYQELMDKLTLLKEDAKSDQERLAQEALENEHKAQALNKYQQMVRNIINANKVAKSKLITRNGIIDEQESTIDEQKKDIGTLQADVENKKNLIAEGEKKIDQTKAALNHSKQQLLAAYRQNKLTKRQFQERTRALQEQSEQKIQNLQAANQTYSNQLNDLSDQLKGTQTQLAGTQSQLAGTRAALADKEHETQALRGQADSLKQKIAGIKDAYEAERGRERAAYEAKLRQGRMDAAERARAEAAYRAEADRRAKEMQSRIAGLSGRLKDTEGELSKAKEEMDARREIAREIKKGFAAAGVKADIDMKTGEVVLDFGDTYFESDSANLKPRMKDIIERAMPIYSKSLFGNQKVANKISSVEIVGFASPTYKGRYVDPRSNKPDDKAALKYNMDLSYRRANSIFSYLVSNKNNDFKYQQDLLSLMKVSGRSFLEVMKVQGRNPASAAEFCKVNDCKKAQKVIVRFSMDGGK